jgi:predicted TIM-barrel fold metal-dependent hydrolase
MKRLTIVSCDGHVGGPVKAYGDYLDPKYRYLLPELVEAERVMAESLELFGLNNPQRLSVMDKRGRIQAGGYDSGWNVAQRMKELDAEGVAAELIYPGTGECMTPFFYYFNKPYPDDVRMAGIRAYHRWLADMIEPAKGRMIGTALSAPYSDVEGAIEEVKFCAERGFRAAFVPGQFDPGAPPLFDKCHEPFWAACNDLGLVLTIHAGWGVKQGVFTSLIEEASRLMKAMKAAGGDGSGFMSQLMNVMSKMNVENPDSIMFLDVGQRQAFWRMIFGGVFDRYPKLKLVIAECRADWLPALKLRMDERFMAAGKRPNLKRKPSEYFGENIFVSPSSPRPREVQMRGEIGIGTFLFGSDFPHPEGTWPNTLEWLRAVFCKVPENELRAILGENAMRVYGLDKDKLSSIAAKIGPLPTDIIGEYEVDEQLIADFEFRSQFSKPTPAISDEVLAAKLDGDLLETAA